jgi:hypothetical protein
MYVSAVHSATFGNNNHKFYNKLIPTVRKESLFPFLLLANQYSYLMMAEIDSRKRSKIK